MIRFLTAAACAIPAMLPAATPLATVHPGWTLTNLRPAPEFQPMVGGMDFLSDGRLVVGHWGGARNVCCPNGSNYGGRQYTGKVYVLSGVLGDDPAGISVDTIATGLEDVMGLAVVRDTIYVSGGNQILRLVRAGNTGPVTRIDTVFILPGTPQTLGSGAGQTSDPSLAGDSLKPVKGRSEWMYGMAVRNDTFYVNPSSMANNGINQINPYRGTTLAVRIGNGTTDKRGSFTIRAAGFRHAAGLAFGPDSALWTVETQGPWVPSNKLLPVKAGAFYGHKHNPAEAWDSQAETPAAVFLPQGTTTSSGSSGGSGAKNASGVFANSPGQPLYLTSGPYAGQMLLGDMSWGGIQRFFLEKVEGEWQGAGFIWMGGLEGGVFRMNQGPDGQIYLGMNGASGDWSWNGRYYGLQKLKYNGVSTFEILAVRARAGGMELEFTRPVDTTAARDTSNYAFLTYFYTPTSSYGGTQSGNATLAKGTPRISPDRMKVFVPVHGLIARTGSQHRVLEITVKKNLRSSTQDTLWNGKAFYTLNALSTSRPFDSATMDIDSRVARSRIQAGLNWTAQAGELRVRSDFRGAYTLSLLDARGHALASASGRGAGLSRLPLGGLRGRFAVLVARGDGLTLRKALMLP